MIELFLSLLSSISLLHCSTAMLNSFNYLYGSKAQTVPKKIPEAVLGNWSEVLETESLGWVVLCFSGFFLFSFFSSSCLLCVCQLGIELRKGPGVQMSSLLQGGGGGPGALISDHSCVQWGLSSLPALCSLMGGGLGWDVIFRLINSSPAS